LFQVAVTEVAGPREGTFACPTFSPRGDRLAAISAAGDIHIWTVEGWNELSMIKAQAGWVLFALDGESVLSEKKNGEITLWRIATGQSLGAFKAHAFDVWPAAISPDRRLLITPNNDSVRLWDVATQREIAQFKGGAGGVTSLAFSADGKTVALGTFDGAIQLWNVASRQQAAALHGHLSFVASLAFSPDGSSLASSGMDNTLRLWKAPALAEIEASKDHLEEKEGQR
jgi:WD40 repeat protein